MIKAMTSLLAFGITIGFILFIPVCSIIIPIETSQELEKYLCHQSSSVPEVIFELNNSNYTISSGDFCIVNKSKNVALYSKTSQPAVITCAQEHHPYLTRGLAFINATVILQGVTFSNCGTYLNTLPDNIADILHSSTMYYTSSHAAALLFIQCTVNMREVVLNSSYGFAMVGINLVDSFLQNMSVVNTTTRATVYNYSNETIIGCGMILHFISYPQTEELNVHAISIEHIIFALNFDIQNCSSCSCANKMDLQSTSEMVVSAAALTILYTQHKYQANVFIDNSIFKDNLGTTGGAVLILHYDSYHGSFVNINNSDFKDNNLLDLQQCYGADVSFIFLSSLRIQTSNDISVPLIIENTIFHNNLLSPHVQRYFKAGAMYIGIKKNDPVNMNMLLKNTKCNNAAAIHTGVCMFAEMLGIYKPGSVTVTLESVDAINSTLSSIIPYASMFTFSRVNCYISGTKEKPSIFMNNFGTVIDATDANIYLSGYILFDGNKGTSGAAIKMKYDSRLHFMNGLTANFTNNQALLGGAIYADVNNKQEECAFYFTSNDIKIFFSNNVATEAGNDIYAFPIFHCQFDDSNHSYTPDQAMRFYKAKVHVLNQNRNRVWSFSTKPTKLLLNNVMTSNGDIYTYPGQMVLSALDELNRFVYGIVKVKIIPKERDSISQLWLSYEDKVRIIQESRYTNYTHINLTVHTTTVCNRSLDGILILSLPEYPEAAVIYSEVHIHPCPPGFILDINTGDCVCSPALHAFAEHNSIPMTCSIQTQTFTRYTETVSWAGLIEMEGGIKVFGISLNCPLGNCLGNLPFDYFQSSGEAERDKVFVAHQIKNGEFHRTPLCINHREGTLCGKCKDGLSVVFGSRKCMHCSNK